MNFLLIFIVILVFLILAQVVLKNDEFTYQFRTKRAGHGMAIGSLVNSGEEKDVTEKETISKIQCPIKNGKKGFWVCNEIIYNNRRKRTGCGCLYDTDYNDPSNLFKQNK
jgi:hypothetical protein